MSIMNTFKFLITHPLNKRKKFSALKRFFKWQISSRLSFGPIIYSWINSTKFIAQKGETGLTGNIYCGLHEFEDMAYLLHVISDTDLFVDVGSNVGSYTLLASGVKNASSISFEPSIDAFNRLNKNIQINKLFDKVNTFNAAVGNKDGIMKFTKNNNLTNHILTEKDDTSEYEEVKIISLDTILKNYSPNIIKIDVEGFELSVLNGALETLRKKSLHSIIMETNGSNNRYGFSNNDLISILEKNGFEAFCYKPFSRKLIHIERINQKSDTGNTIFIRNAEKIKLKLINAPSISINNVEV